MREINTLARRSASGPHADLHRILQGTKVNERPVQFPAKFELVINLKPDKAIGLSVPENVPAARRRGD